MMLTVLRLHERPIDSYDSLALEPLQRFREGEEARARFLVEPDFAEIRPAFCRAYRHDTIVFEERLKMAVRFWFLPECVDLRAAAFFYDRAKSDGLDLEKLHSI